MSALHELSTHRERNGLSFVDGAGGLMFGLGWAMTGACPGPLYALIGSGLPIVIVILLSAVFGTYVYGVMKDKLPH